MEYYAALEEPNPGGEKNIPLILMIYFCFKK